MNKLRSSLLWSSRRLSRVCLTVTLVFSLVGPLSAALVQWTGAAGDGLWNNPLNWAGGVVPANGDDVDFGANSSPQSRLNFSLQLGSFTFDTNATSIDTHVGAGTASTLTFTGAGIVNNTPFISGQGPQNFFADASSGPTGGTLLFTGTASISGSSNTTLTASGASVAGGGGGTIIFQDHSSTAIDLNYNGLVAEGATITGAGGGTLILRDDAVAQTTTQIAARGGTGASASGGQITIQDRAQVDSNITALGGNDGGFGGRVDFHNNAAIAGGMIANEGANSSLSGSEAVTRFFDNSTFNGVGQNLGGTGSGLAGGRLEFHDHSVLGNVGTVAGYDFVSILNLGGDGVGHGRTLFYDDSSIIGTMVGIYNSSDGQTVDDGGSLEFHDRSHAGQAMISNAGAEPDTTTLGARTLFFDVSSADSAKIENFGGSGAGTPGGVTQFRNNSTAGNATLLADSGTSGGLGGRILFQDSASGGTARIITDVGGVFDISALTTAGTTVGSIEGGGDFYLGGKLLTVGSNGLSTEVAGGLHDGGQAGGMGGGLAKVGAGTLTLSGTNTYTGSTAVNSGGLFVNGTVGGSGVTVASGASLGGTGTINAPVLISGGATLAPGSAAAPGTFTIGGDLTLNGGASTNYRLGAPGVVGGPLNDLLTVSGNVTLAGTLNVTDAGGFGLGSYRLINYGGTAVNNGWAIGTFPTGFSAADFTIQVGSGQVNLIVGGSNVLFWDGPQTVANSLVDGGTGTWNNSTSSWTDSGGVANVAWGSHFAIFTGAAGTVTVTEPVNSTGMQFITNGYAVNANPGGAIALSGAATVQVSPGATATINAPLTGSGSLLKADTGTLTLGGHSTYSGGTTIQDGVIIVTNAAGMGLGTGPVTVLATSTSLLEFANTASAGGLSITNVGGAGSFSGSTYFVNTATAGSATLTNQGNLATGGGGGFVDFFNGSNAGSATINNAGGAFAPFGFGYYGSGYTDFSAASSAANAQITNFGALSSVSTGGETLFDFVASAGNSTIINQAGTVAGAPGGHTDFTSSSTAGQGTFSALGTQVSGARPGVISFQDTSTAAQGSFTLGGASVASGAGGEVNFYNGATAGTATFLIQAGSAPGNLAGGGSVTFQGTSAAQVASAGNATFTTVGSTGSTVGVGSVSLNAFSTAANGTFFNEGGVATGGAGGAVQLFSGSTAGNGLFHNQGATVDGALGGVTVFFGTSTAGSATLYGEAGVGTGAGGRIDFFDTSTGGTARVILSGTGVGAGVLDISESATASLSIGSIEGDGGQVSLGSRTLSVGGTNTNTTFGGVIAGSGGLIKTGTGSLTLSGASSYIGGTTLANGELIVTNAAGLALGTGPVVDTPTATSELRFAGGGSAGTVTITNLGAATTTVSALTDFNDTATAGTARIKNQGNTANGGYGGTALFFGSSTAGSATITNAGTSFQAPSFAPSNGAGVTGFRENSTAGGATIINAGSLTAGTLGGNTFFVDNSSGGLSFITNAGGQAVGLPGGSTSFYNTSSAGGGAIFTNGGIVSGAPGGFTYFHDSSTAGTAILYANNAPAGAVGGSVVFADDSTGGMARALIQGSPGSSPGGLDISELSSTGMTIGSLSGGGTVSLGSKHLQIGGNGLSSTFSGLVRDGGFVNGAGGSLSIVGSGALTLSGANTYTGGTTIGDGMNPTSGKLIVANPTGSATGSGPVSVNRGGTLSGSGHIAGPVTLNPGGLIAPGDPVTLTLDNDLTWNGGSSIQLFLGDNQADSDQIDILGVLRRGDPGDFHFNLVDGGAVPGLSYELLHVGSMEGFVPSDFTFSGIQGDFTFENGSLDFVPTVPEPTTFWLCALGGTIPFAGFVRRRLRERRKEGGRHLWLRR